MDTESTAREVLDACGGVDNVDGNAVCMTRLRLTLRDPQSVDTDAIESLHGVLGVRRRGSHGLEVVFGPAIVDAIAAEFSRLTSQPMERKTAKAITQLTADGPREVDHLHSTRRYGGDRASSTDHVGAPFGTADSSDLDELRRLLESAGGALAGRAPAPVVDDLGHRVLVINGPNLNLLGVREPDIYGDANYESLVRLCESKGAELGFSVECFQSNHEGDIVDKIQEALTDYDGIVINPAAYTHTSVAILDAVKAVGVPTVEVHISDVSEREPFRSVSYVRDACIATVMGEGFDGYVHAMRILKERLDSEE